MSILVVHESLRWLAVDKPPGMVVVPARNEDPQASLWRTLERERGERLWVVHRIDRDTSGLVVLARDADAHRALSMAFEHRRVAKAYTLLTRGLPPAERGVIDTPLHPARRGKMRPALPGEAGALAASTAYQLLRRWDTAAGPVGLVEARPRTGRHHQIRVHLRSVGAPLLVDPLYGRAPRVTAAELGLHSDVALERLALHASRLELPSPEGEGEGELVSLSSPLPADLAALIAALSA